MQDISRRRFLRGASLGAAALGTAAAVGQGPLNRLVASPANGAAKAAMATGMGGDERPEGAKAEVMAHVVGGPSGTIEIYSGTNVVMLHDRGMANALLSALRS
jgi:nitrous oxide reductase